MSTRFNGIKAMDLDDMVDFIASISADCDEPEWLKWFGEKYCDNCEIVEVCNEFGGHLTCSYCELYNECKFHLNAPHAWGGIPDDDYIIELWLNAEV